MNEDIISRYEGMKKHMLDFFQNPTGRIVVISGENSTGKTYQVHNVAEKNGFRVLDHRDLLQPGATGGDKTVLVVGAGRYGPTFLYELFHACNDHPLQFEENIFLNMKNRHFLLEALDSGFQFRYPGENPPHHLPSSFHYTGGLLITTYQPPSSIHEELLNHVELVDVTMRGDPENMLRLLEHELESIVRAYNRKMSATPISLEEAAEAMALYREVFENRRKTHEIRMPYMVTFIFVFEMLRSLTTPSATEEQKVNAITRSFTEIPGHVSVAYQNSNSSNADETIEE